MTQSLVCLPRGEEKDFSCLLTFRSNRSDDLALSMQLPPAHLWWTAGTGLGCRQQKMHFEGSLRPWCHLRKACTFPVVSHCQRQQGVRRCCQSSCLAQFLFALVGFHFFAKSTIQVTNLSKTPSFAILSLNTLTCPCHTHRIAALV